MKPLTPACHETAAGRAGCPQPAVGRPDATAPRRRGENTAPYQRLHPCRRFAIAGLRGWIARNLHKLLLPTDGGWKPPARIYGVGGGGGVPPPPCDDGPVIHGVTEDIRRTYCATDVFGNVVRDVVV